MKQENIESEKIINDLRDFNDNWKLRILKQNISNVQLCISTFIHKVKLNCENIFNEHKENWKKLKGAKQFTLEHKQWLLDPRTIHSFKENEWTCEERCQAFR